MVAINKFGKLKDSEIEGVAQRKRVTLTSAQILALNSTAVDIIPAPGANKAISVDEIVVRLDAGGTQYTGSNALEFRYTNASGAKVTGDIAAACLNSASDRTDKAIAAAATLVANAKIVAVVPTANPGAGNGTLLVDVLYRVVNI